MNLQYRTFSGIHVLDSNLHKVLESETRKAKNKKEQEKQRKKKRKRTKKKRKRKTYLDSDEMVRDAFIVLSVYRIQNHQFILFYLFDCLLE